MWAKGVACRMSWASATARLSIAVDQHDLGAAPRSIKRVRGCAADHAGADDADLHGHFPCCYSLGRTAVACHQHSVFGSGGPDHACARREGALLRRVRHGRRLARRASPATPRPSSAPPRPRSSTGTASPMLGGSAISRRWKRCRTGHRPFTRPRRPAPREPAGPARDDVWITGLDREAEIDRSQSCLAPPRSLARFGGGPARACKSSYILATLSNGNVALMVNMAQARRAALGRDPGAEVARRLQAAAGGLSALRGPARPAACALYDGRGAQ